MVGAGIVGLACALRLAQSGAAVTLFNDASGAPPASLGNAGHIATEQVVPIASPAALRSAWDRLYWRGGALAFRPGDLTTWLPFAWRYLRACRPATCEAGTQALSGLLDDALSAWAQLARDLHMPHLVQDHGHVVVWESAATAAAGQRQWAQTPIGRARIMPLQAEDLSALQKRVSGDIHSGIYFNNTGQVSDPIDVINSLKQALHRLGVVTLDTQVTRIEASREGFVVHSSKLAAQHYAQVLISGGVGSGALMQTLGHRTPIIAERGYHVEGVIPAWDATTPVVFEDRSLIITRFGQRTRAASFVEFGRASSPPDPGKWRRLHRHLQELGLRFEGPVSQWMGARPTLPDYLPAIGFSRRHPGLAYAFGHQHLGLTLAAVTAQRLALAWLDPAHREGLKPFDIERFAG